MNLFLLALQMGVVNANRCAKILVIYNKICQVTRINNCKNERKERIVMPGCYPIVVYLLYRQKIDIFVAFLSDFKKNLSSSFLIFLDLITHYCHFVEKNCIY